MDRCPQCRTKFLTDHAFCPNCGFDLRINNIDTSNKASGKEETLDSNQDPELRPPPIENDEQQRKESTRLTGIITTFVWSSALSVITVFLYYLKGRTDIDFILKELIGGTISKPIFVFLVAFIISLFARKKAEMFNSVCTWLMVILTISEIVRWL
jgi:hypothetical protein